MSAQHGKSSSDTAKEISSKGEMAASVVIESALSGSTRSQQSKTRSNHSLSVSQSNLQRSTASPSEKPSQHGPGGVHEKPPDPRPKHHRPDLRKLGYRHTLKRYLFQPMSGLVAHISRIVLVVVNLLLLMIGLTMFAVGCTIFAMAGSVTAMLEEKTERTYNTAVKTLKETRTYDVANPPDLSVAINTVAFVAIVIGSLIGVVSLMGSIGSCLAHRRLVSMYSQLCSILLIAELVLIVYVYGKRNIGKEELAASLKKYRGHEFNDTISVFWNAIMWRFQCCGVDNYKDFSRSVRWPPRTVGGKSVALETPINCCKGRNINISNVACAETGNVNPAVNNMNIGCYDIVFDWLFHNQRVVNLVVSAFVFQVVMLFFSCWLMFNIKETS
ncbi:tetraspanin [Elysia marginata]|uniref:Tetraspanin n=1 Tax=Elysia marginata TaxID=1093978 RepID=A0AAV4H1E5_9GAST|nr:tetraspanin [Elysia marginata]